MDAIDTLGLLAQLEEESCELNHGPDTAHEKHPAVDYIIQPFGYSVNEVEDFTAREMVIPVCADCAGALHGDEWTLLYCFECNSSQWVSRKLANNRYRHSVLWLRGCPHCSEKFGGLYFTDFKAVVENPLFMSLLSIPKIA
ncbi:MAG: hypothetical protein OEV64_11995 [Desulfobulbaceae bacterium]|nr:hypothetical protein [Desulfobulbaceae bacterium]